MYIIRRELDLNDPALRKSITDMLESLEGNDNFEAIVRGMIDECVYDPYGMCALRRTILEKCDDFAYHDVYLRLFEYVDDCISSKTDMPVRVAIARLSDGQPIGDALDRNFIHPALMMTDRHIMDWSTFEDRIIWCECRQASDLDELLYELYLEYYGKPEFSEILTVVRSRYEFHSGCISETSLGIQAVYEKYLSKTPQAASLPE